MGLAERQDLDRAAGAGDRQRRAGRYGMAAEDRRIEAARRGAEAIGKGFEEPFVSRRIGIDVDQPLGVEEERAEIVDAVRMVGVVMRVEHAVEVIDTRGKKLRAHIRAGVDQNAGRPLAAVEALDEERASRPAVLGFRRVAGAPIIADPRNARRCAAAENGDHEPRHPQPRGTLVNKRWKFSVVARRQFIRRQMPDLGQNFRRISHIGRFVAAPAVRDRGEIWCVGLDQQPLERQLGRYGAQFRRSS